MSGCEQATEKTGTLVVHSSSQDSFDIYRIGTQVDLTKNRPESTTVHFTSERVGYYNEPLELPPGQYLVLADCSSQTVIVYPGVRHDLNARRVEFLAPIAPNVEDEFSIQCERSVMTRSRQTFSNKFHLNTLVGSHEILVGMVPLRLAVGLQDQASGPESLIYELAALQVAQPAGITREQLYFVSPVDEKLSVTVSQRFGHWLYLLPGDYLVEVNGTRLTVSLRKGESRVIEPARLRINSPPSIDLDAGAQVVGHPPYVEINDGHYLEFNETYAVLPSLTRIRLGGSLRVIESHLDAGSLLEIATRAVTVHLDCSPWEWTCLGETDVMLYFEDQPYPFLESISDVPVLFAETDQHVLVGIEGSRDILYRLPKDGSHVELKVGTVRLIPKPTFKQGQVTDLIRVEAVRGPLEGNTLDIGLDEPTIMPLIAGHYQIAHYVSLSIAEGERRRTLRSFDIGPGDQLDLEFPVYLSEKQYKAFERRLESVAKGRDAAPATEESTYPRAKYW